MLAMTVDAVYLAYRVALYCCRCHYAADRSIAADPAQSARSRASDIASKSANCHMLGRPLDVVPVAALPIYYLDFQRTYSISSDIP